MLHEPNVFDAVMQNPNSAHTERGVCERKYRIASKVLRVEEIAPKLLEKIQNDVFKIVHTVHDQHVRMTTQLFLPSRMRN